MKSVNRTLASLFIENRSGYWGGTPESGKNAALVVRNSDVETKGVRWDRTPLRGLTTDEYKRASLHKGDLVITTSGECGRVTILREDPPQPAVASNFVRLLRVDQNIADASYLFYWFNTPHARASLRPYIRGTTLKNLATNVAFENISLALPDVLEQRHAASLLEKAEEIRRNRAKAGELAKSFHASLYLELFGDPALNPKGWRKVRLGQGLIRLQGGFAFKSKDYLPEGIPLVRIGNANKGAFSLGNLVFLPPAYVESHSKWLLAPGDMLITLTGTVGKDDYGNVCIVPSEYPQWFLNQRVAKIEVLSDDVTATYVEHFLRHPRT